ncbi:NADH dehydrogenase subunit 5 [Amylocarpus encephaloides]|uniref:NADH dehydrogenase subunit 5 n=1 Tax=Amylocarpus encephaloides TaxID=45428 RepID=A0A9P7Y832_9HELO|nr:NADH dehydrogenase subunit 5 [Amylocarpus encephaloides]
MYLAIITLPLLGSIVSGFFGRKVGVSGAQLITCTSVIVTTLLAIVAFFEVVSMLIPVLIVSSLVHIYSIGYMSHDPHNQRFFSYLSLFTFMMIILVTANNFLLMFVGIAANQSSMSAFLTNRVGDCFLTIGITVFSLAPFVNENIVTIIGICLLIGAMAKSSQGPTPVSALIHAATMVTAGAITTVFSSLIGLFQQDIKKVIAYSTMSQLAREYNQSS